MKMSHLLRSPSSSSSFHRNGKLHKQCVSLLALNVNSCLYSFSFLFSGNFEPPGARAVASFVNEYDRETDPRWLAVKEAGRRAERAEKAAERAEKAMAGGHAPIGEVESCFAFGIGAVRTAKLTSLTENSSGQTQGPEVLDLQETRGYNC
jgi:hypothetical protein